MTWKDKEMRLKIVPAVLVWTSIAFPQRKEIEGYYKSKHPACDITTTNVVLGDLNGDRIPEAVFRTTVECDQAAIIPTFGIFSKQNGSYILKQQVDSLKWADTISINKGVIRLAGMAYDKDDSPCCPSIKMEKYFSMSGDTLVDETAQRHSVKDQSNGGGSIAEIQRKLDRLNAERFKYLSYNISGQVSQIESGVAILWGTAIRQYSYGSAGTYQPGELLDDGFISILKLDPNLVPSNNYYSGTHCFVKRVASKDKLGRGIWVYVYGPCPAGKAKLDREIEDLVESKRHLEYGSGR